MPGKGKYTTYVPKKSARRNFMEKLFASSPFAGVDDADAPALLSDMGNKLLIPSVQQGNPDLFPQGVSLDYDHPNAPKVDEVKWTRRGDPSNAYVPDLKSPGPGPDGQVNTSPNETNPEISIDDVKPNYVPGTLGTSADGGTGTVDPTATADKISQGTTLGKDLTLGSSQKVNS